MNHPQRKSAATRDNMSGDSPWSPLRKAIFRSIWIALIVSNIGTWMQSVGTSWLMTSLTPSPLLVALMQTAILLPVFLFGLPAGALADIVDRRKLLLITETWLLLIAFVLGILTFAEHINAWALLALTFLMGLGSALDAPLWQAIVPDLVERQDLPAAVALNATGFNVARAIGPALGGLVIATMGPAAVFFLNAVSFLWVLVAIYRWRRTIIPSNTPPEDILGAIVAGMRYVRHAPALQAVLVRIGVFTIGASALWALLPAVARYELNLGAAGYGILLGSFGFGAVSSALIQHRLRALLSVDRLTAAAAVVFAGATLALAYIRFVPLLVICLMMGGMAWLATSSSLTTAATTVAPAWVRARALGLYLLVFAGAMSIGSFAWGALAENFGNGFALTVAALFLVVGLVATRYWSLKAIQHLDLSPSMHWPEPQVAITPAPEDGPVMVTVEYRVSPEQADKFIHAMEEMRRFRYREGAIRWDFFRDLADPDRYLEIILAPSWAEHMRQHARVTVMDQEIEAHAFSFVQPGVNPTAAHLIAIHPDDRQIPTVPYTQLT
ncbi:MAG: MFS transporter [Anaerolineales bacterium]|nr:MFS transporter [Anaerolineales bacterium]